LEPGGVALAHGDLDTSGILFDKARSCAARLITFGEDAGLDVRVTDLRISDEATVLKIDDQGTERLLKLGAPGRHYGMNAMIALAAAEAAGADPTRAALSLASWHPFEGRGTRETVILSQTDGLSVQMIDDAFNANPASMAAALEVLAAAAPDGRGRRIAVLGDMLELGPTAPGLHAAIAGHPALARIDQVHTVGPLMQNLHAALPAAIRGLHCETADEMAQTLARHLKPDDVLLIKGSKGIKVSRVVDALRKLGQAAVYHKRGSR
ncbi:MAG: cyanophycin synthetase, partial [Roseicyclus sp.]